MDNNIPYKEGGTFFMENNVLKVLLKQEECITLF